MTDILKPVYSSREIKKIGVSFESLFDVFSLWNRFHKKKYGSFPIEEFEIDKEFGFDEGYEICLKNDDFYKEKKINFMKSESYLKRNPVEHSVDAIDELTAEGFDLILLNSYFCEVPESNLSLIKRHFEGRFDGDIYFANSYKNQSARPTFICLDKAVDLLIDVDYEQTKEFANSDNPSFLLDSPRNEKAILSGKWKDYVTPVSSWKEITKRLC